MATFDTWESYFYPPPDDATMRNLQDIRDPKELEIFEYAATSYRQKQLHLGPSIVPHKYDAAHVRAIHRYLFQDVYEWAGEYRTRNMVKFGYVREFADVHRGEVDRYLSDVHRLVGNTEWAQLTRAEFGRAAVRVFAHLNQAHPFREGNGRTSKVFMEHVAQRSRYTLDFGLVSGRYWNMASELSRPDIGSYAVVPASLEPVFEGISLERSNGSVTTGRDVSFTRSYLSACYPPSTQPSTGTRPWCCVAAVPCRTAWTIRQGRNRTMTSNDSAAVVRKYRLSHRAPTPAASRATRNGHGLGHSQRVES